MTATKVLKSSFIYSVPSLSMMRNHDHEIAVIGRSNVGKSSLINVLCHKKDLARTSKMPGRTRHAVVYELVLAQAQKQKDLILVDLPGFGFANMSKSEAHECEQLIFSYVAERKTLGQIFLLLDIRREADSREKQLIELAKDRHIDLVLVLTKCDKIALSKRKPALKKMAESLKLPLDSLVLHTTYDETFTEDLRSLIFEHQ